PSPLSFSRIPTNGGSYMITRMSHATIYVLDQQSALEFYRDKLGFKVHTDATMDGGFRWITVCPPDQPDFEIALMEPKPGFGCSEETANQLKEMIKTGVLGAGVFDTPNIEATYEELKGKGVEFLAPPEDKFYAIEA